MVQAVEIPLSWANNIPGVSGIEDVQFDVPQLSDIAAEIERALPDLGIVVEFFEELGEQRDPGEPLFLTLAEAVAAEIGEELIGEQLVEEISLEELATLIADDLDVSIPSEIDVGIEGGLFSLDDDVIEFATEVVTRLEAAGVIPLVDIPDLLDPLTDAESEFSLFVSNPAQFIDDAVSVDLSGTLDDVLPDWVTLSLPEAAELLVKTGVDQAVDDQTQQDLAAKAEEFR